MNSQPLRGVLLDVGGVLLIPDGAVVGAALRQHGIDHSSDYHRAHYYGVASFDGAAGDDKASYLTGYVDALAPSDPEAAMAILLPLWDSPGIGLWRSVVTQSVAGLRRLSEEGIPLGIVSNSDGTVEEALRAADICQVGAGVGVPVLAIIDSAAAGIAKPDPMAFAPAVEALGLPADSIAFVGDSVRHDVEGAAAAGLRAFHFDPLRLCTEDDHEHVTQLDELIRTIAG